MKKGALFFLFVGAYIVNACATDVLGKKDNTEQIIPISGRVTCLGKPVEGAIISDGVDLVKTDTEGIYFINAHKHMEYVFISIPSGYSVAKDGILPAHCLPIKGTKMDHADFELLPMPNESYKLFVMADIHLVGDAVFKDLKQFRTIFLPDISQTLNETSGEKFSISLGDMTTDNRWYKNNFMLPNYLNEFKKYPTMIYHVMGNHDNDPAVMGLTDEDVDWKASRAYRKYIGPTYYSLNIGDVHYIMLDNIIGLGNRKYKYYIDSVQLEWLKKDLSFVDKETPLIVSMHVPAYRYSGLSNGIPIIEKRSSEYQDVSVLIDLLKPYSEVHILSGHDHRNRNICIADNITEHTLASASAISWQLNDIRPITTDGTLSGYQIFEISGKKIRWFYKAVGLPIEKSQFRAYDMNAVPKEYCEGTDANEIIVNVFNWDPLWRVAVYEDGQELAVEQFWGKDPLYMYLRDRTQQFNHRPNDWRAVSNIHMFRAKAKRSDSQIIVRVTDRFGIVYEEKMERPKYFFENMN